MDCNGIYCRQNPREGAKLAVAEAARNLACAGAIPLAVTDNLNFGNPYDSKNFLQLREAVEGLAEACRAFNIPVTVGNVSLYNENPAGPIDPTPTVGMVGLIADPKHITSQFFKQAGDVILLIGGLGSELGASHFLKVVHDRKTGPLPGLTSSKKSGLTPRLAPLFEWVPYKAPTIARKAGSPCSAEACLSGPTAFGADIDFGLDGGSALTSFSSMNPSPALLFRCRGSMLPRRWRSLIGGAFPPGVWARSRSRIRFGFPRMATPAHGRCANLMSLGPNQLKN